MKGTTMHKVNDMYGKEVINQSTGERVAAMRDVILSDDARRIVAVGVGGGMWSKEERSVRWETVTSVGDFVIADGSEPFPIVDEDATIAELRKQANQITGTMILSSSGERLGTVGDMYYEQDGTVSGYSIKQGILDSSRDAPFLPAEHIQVVGKDAIIANVNDLTLLHGIEPTDETAHEPDADRFREPTRLHEPPVSGQRERAVGKPAERIDSTRYDPVDVPAEVPLERPQDTLPTERGDLG
jgi:uncharacterized protein YrrD